MRFDSESTADVVLVAVLFALLLASVVPTRGTGATVAFGVGLDKWLHIAGFAVVTVSLAAAWRSRGCRLARVAVVAVVAFALGVAIELVQLPIPWRHADGLDIVADGVGVAVGVVVRTAWVTWSAWSTRNHPPSRDSDS